MDDIKKPQNPQPTQPPAMDFQPRFAQEEQPTPIPPPAGSPVPEQPASPAPATEGAPVLAAIAQPHKSHRAPIMAIVSAIVLTGVFAAIAVLAYTSDSNPKQAADSNQQITDTTQDNAATATDVTETEKAIDDSLSGADDASDFNDADMSDTTLGL